MQSWLFSEKICWKRRPKSQNFGSQLQSSHLSRYPQDDQWPDLFLAQTYWLRENDTIGDPWSLIKNHLGLSPWPQRQTALQYLQKIWRKQRTIEQKSISVRSSGEISRLAIEIFASSHCHWSDLVNELQQPQTGYPLWTRDSFPRLWRKRKHAQQLNHKKLRSWGHDR